MKAKIFVDKNFFEPKFSLDSKCFGPKVFLDPNFFLSQNFFEPKLYLYPNFKVFFNPNVLDQIFFLPPKQIFLTKKKFCALKSFGHKIFCTQNVDQSPILGKSSKNIYKTFNIVQKGCSQKSGAAKPFIEFKFGNVIGGGGGVGGSRLK